MHKPIVIKVTNPSTHSCCMRTSHLFVLDIKLITLYFGSENV